MNFILKEPKSDKDTLIYLMYYPNKFKYSTGKRINPNDWDFNSKMPLAKRGRADLKHLSSVLNQYTDLLNKLLDNKELNNESVTKEYLKNEFDIKFKGKGTFKYRKNNNEKVTECIEKFIEVKNKSKGQSTSWNGKYKNLISKLNNFEAHSKKSVTFNNLNDDFIDEYCGFLRDKKEKPYNDNTLNRHINLLFTFLNWSRGKYHDIPKLKNPVKKYQPEDVHLTFKEIESLEKLELRPALERVRDVFLIGIYSGQRYSDYSVFEKADVKKTPKGEIIIKKAEKTENDCYIPVTPKLKKILEKYKWKLPLISEQNFREHLTEVCIKAEIKEEVKSIIYRGNKKTVTYSPKYDLVSTHTARRTFITLSAENGMPDHIIMKITGIRDVKTLQKYKKTSQTSVEDFMFRIWS